MLFDATQTHLAKSPIPLKTLEDDAARGKVPDMYAAWKEFLPPVITQNRFLFNAGFPPQNFTSYYRLL